MSVLSSPKGAGKISNPASGLLDKAIIAQRRHLRAYEQPSEPLAFETVRAIDHVFCRELFPEAHDIGDLDSAEARIMSWGVNGALSRILPNSLRPGPFKLFPSTEDTQAKADAFLFQCGVLALAERQAGLLREGLLKAHVQRVDDPIFRKTSKNILALSAADPSLYGEAIGREGERWSSTQATLAARGEEAELEDQHRKLLPELDRQVEVLAGRFMRYAPPPDVYRHFQKWAELYLRRMPHQDMIGNDEIIGGRRFSDYVEVLTGLSTFAQMRLCYAGLLKHRHPGLTFRNLITGFVALDDLLVGLASILDADTLEVQRLLSHLTLDPTNKAAHLERGETSWAPVMHTSQDTCLLPSFGLDINPFLFLFADLRAKYEKDWFNLANEREGRWIEEFRGLFPAPRWQATSRGVKLRRGSQTVTDIDFAAYDDETGELGLFQLKWQQPVATDHKVRRSTGSNLLIECNRWIANVREWIREFGAVELGRRLGLRFSKTPEVRLFVLARYGAHFSGYGGQNEEAIWTGWGHFRKARHENLRASVTELAELVAAEIGQARASVRPESVALPLPGLAVIVNPTAMPGMPDMRANSNPSEAG